MRIDRQLQYSYSEVLKIVQKQKQEDFWVSFCAVWVGFVLGLIFAKIIFC